MVNVFSFCLYGRPNPRYYPIPMIQNIELVQKHFPGWKVYLYVSPDIDMGFLHQVSKYSNVVIKSTKYNWKWRILTKSLLEQS